jgi:Flp pilus assembly protein TadG
MVEFAIVLPIFMLVLSGICDFGFMLYQRMTVISAAREGARAASIVEDPGVGGAAITNAASGAATAAAASGGVTVTVAAPVCYQTSSNPSSTTPIDCSTVINGDSVAVTVNYTYHMFFPLAFGSTFNLSSTVQMVFDNLT